MALPSSCRLYEASALVPLAHYPSATLEDDHPHPTKPTHPSTIPVSISGSTQIPDWLFSHVPLGAMDGWMDGLIGGWSDGGMGATTLMLGPPPVLYCSALAVLEGRGGTSSPLPSLLPPAPSVHHYNPAGACGPALMGPSWTPTFPLLRPQPRRSAPFFYPLPFNSFKILLYFLYGRLCDVAKLRIQEEEEEGR
ncbi:unnamed protein product [Pleuronectes platessa]|uniref:Uncharacterized protein n=1 Tax=Pleuronectes platessa TaxID=8262 RepID=A0A9N7YJJ4_PLEPL|nr:unnamed protein product [Pleuronectes platessa]